MGDAGGEVLLLIPQYVVGGVEFWSLVYDPTTDTARIICELIDAESLGHDRERVVLKRTLYPADETSRSAVPDFFWECVPRKLAERRGR
jgi:hypothetical protein